MTGTTTITFNNQQFSHGVFTSGTETDFSLDLGGVVEYYLLTRESSPEITLRHPGKKGGISHAS